MWASWSHLSWDRSFGVVPTASVIERRPRTAIIMTMTTTAITMAPPTLLARAQKTRAATMHTKGTTATMTLTLYGKKTTSSATTTTTLLARYAKKTLVLLPPQGRDTPRPGAYRRRTERGKEKPEEEEAAAQDQGETRCGIYRTAIRCTEKGKKRRPTISTWTWISPITPSQTVYGVGVSCARATSLDRRQQHRDGQSAPTMANVSTDDEGSRRCRTIHNALFSRLAVGAFREMHEMGFECMISPDWSHWIF